MDEHATREVQRLLRLERMMTDAYDIALRKMNDPRLVEVLAPFRKHHDQNSRSLDQLLQGTHMQAERLDSAFKRYVEEVLDALGEAVRRDEALGELRIAEAALNMEYAHAIEMEPEGEYANTLKECMRSEPEHIGVLSMAAETRRT